MKRPTARLAIALALCSVAPWPSGSALADGAGIRGSASSTASGTPTTGPSGGRPDSRGARARMYSLQGTAPGDRLPVIVANPLGAGEPWVVWSRFTGADYDVVWSRWMGTDWAPVQSIVRDVTPGDDLDADLTFDAQGHAFAAWWRDHDGLGQVFVSVHLGTRWSHPLQVSEALVDSRYPVLRIRGAQEIELQFRTPSGRVSRTLALTQPATITDDINPIVIPLDLVPTGN